MHVLERLMSHGEDDRVVPFLMEHGSEVGPRSFDLALDRGPDLCVGVHAQVRIADGDLMSFLEEPLDQRLAEGHAHVIDVLLERQSSDEHLRTDGPVHRPLDQALAGTECSHPNALEVRTFGDLLHGVFEDDRVLAETIPAHWARTSDCVPVIVRIRRFDHVDHIDPHR